jgi:hypothetical protein
MCRISVQRVSPPTIFVQCEEVVANEATIDRKRPLEDAQEEEEEETCTVDLRSGKWTPEEEVYADAVIAQFESGTLSDCAEGKTLRAYLSKKLNCIPMRVSKKYGGKCIGKHSYHPVTTVQTPEEIERMEHLSRECWSSIDKRVNNRRKRVKHVSGKISDGSSSDTAESVPSSEHTDKEDVVFDEFLFDDFFASEGEYFGPSDDAVAVMADYFSPDVDIAFNDWVDLSDDCLLVR